jgi:hypothetical protein
MPDLEPNTREEHFLNGDELTPETRREYFYAGKENELIEISGDPDANKPKTREEWFIQKYRSGGEIVLEDITITENGEVTAPSGKAYKKITTDVPLPQNAYLIKSLPNTPTSIATITDASALVMPSLKIGVEPIQSGSGTPSPTNIRPISGWSGANVTVCDDVSDPTETHTTTIQFTDGSNPLVVYGGEVDVVNGGGTIDRQYKKGLRVSNVGTSGTGIKYADCLLNANSLNPSINDGFGISSNYKYIKASVPATEGSFRVYSNSVTFYSNDFTDVTTATALLEDTEICIELATPSTFNSQPTAISTIANTNNIFADCGQILEGEYWSKEV